MSIKTNLILLAIVAAGWLTFNQWLLAKIIG
jgi:hypothetical protein